MSGKYILPVRPDICREITKRRVYSHRKDEKTGKIKKSKNPNGTSSPFGWGTVTDTFMLNTKILDNVRRNLALYILQIDKQTYLEKEVAVPIKRKEPIVNIVPEQPVAKKARIAPLIKSWYDNCDKNLRGGSIGLVPDCWSNRETMPPIDEIMCTQVGEVLTNFTRYLKNKL